MWQAGQRIGSVVGGTRVVFNLESELFQAEPPPRKPTLRM
jgi:hypothetical protein